MGAWNPPINSEWKDLKHSISLIYFHGVVIKHKDNIRGMPKLNKFSIFATSAFFLIISMRSHCMKILAKWNYILCVTHAILRDFPK
jgi:hypothetical protein